MASPPSTPITLPVIQSPPWPDRATTALAMSSGVPVVVTSIYGIPEIVVDGETGLLVPPGESGPLTEALRQLVTDGGLRARMGRASRRRYERSFTLEIMASRTYAVLAGRGEA